MNHRRTTMIRQPRSVTSRGCTLRTTIEPLEARSMLSASSPTVDQVADRIVEVVRVDEIAPATLYTIVDGLIGGVGSRTEFARIIDSRSDGQPISGTDPSRELTLLIPPVSDYAPSVPGSVSDRDTWQDDSTIPMPDDSGPGGFTEVTDFEVPYAENKEQSTPSASSRILDILATLHYLPEGLRPEFGESVEVASSLDDEPHSVESELQTAEFPASGPASSESASDGGMLPLAPVEEFLAVAEVQSSEPAGRSTPTFEPIPLQQMQGKFQAFEMSHGETVPAAEVTEEATSSEAEPLPELPSEPVLQTSYSPFFVGLEVLETALADFNSEDPSHELTDARDREDSAVEALILPAVDPAAAAIFILSVTTALRTPRDPQAQPVTVKRISTRPIRG